MNIFYLHNDPKICAEQHVDKHVVKMIVESAQMLSTTHRVMDGDKQADLNGLYKMAHRNHPSTIWARTGAANYIWLLEHMKGLMKEYTRRYGKVHTTETKLLQALSSLPQNIDIGAPFTPPPQCMPDELKDDDTVVAYRNYYLTEKAYFAKWKDGNKPDWFNVGFKNAT